MPHQVIFCQDQTFCGSEYMIVSLYDYQQYMQNFQTLLTYENNGINFSNILSMSQGKYITSAISQSKPNQTEAQEAGKDLASYAKQEAAGYVCDAAQAAADGFPVCGTIRFFTDYTNGFFDLG